jgi:uncharacterized protein YjdB
LGGNAGTLTGFYLFPDGSVAEGTEAGGNLPSFSSDAPSVVSVSSDGSLTALAQGTATLTASSGALVAVATVSVTPASSVQGIVFAPDDLLTLEEGVTQQFTANALPLSDNVSVVSSNPAVLSVDSVTGNGAFVTAEVRGVASGQADLTFRSQDDADVFDVVRIHVVELTSLAVEPGSASFPVSGLEGLTANLLGTDGTYSFAFPASDAQWSSSAPAVAPVFPNGKVVGLAVGSATVTAQSLGNPALQDSVPVTVTGAVGLPDAGLSGLAGQDIVANGVNVGAVVYGRGSQSGGTIASAPSVEQVFIVDNGAAATAPLEVVFVETDTDRLVASASAGAIAAGRVGALEIEVTLPSSAIGTSNPGATSGTVTVYTNDPFSHQLDVAVSWTWQQGSGVQADASTTMFLDFGDVPDAASRDRTFFFDTGQAGDRVTGVTVNNLVGSAFSLRANPNPFMNDSFPETQTNADVSLTFTLRATPNATSGTFLGTVAFANDDVDEPVIEALVVAYGTPAAVSQLPGDLASATLAESTLRTLNGSERTLIPIPSGNDGLEYDAGTGAAYLLSGSAFAEDPGAGANDFDARLFKVPSLGRPVKVPASLSDDMVGLAANFAQNRSYALDLSGTRDDIVRITDGGSVSILAAGVTSSSRLAVDSAGDLYVSRVIVGSLIRLRKYSDGGTLLASFPNSSAIRAFELANVSGVDTLYTDLGTKLDTDGVQVGTYVMVPDFQWFTVDGTGHILFGDGSGATSEPQSLILGDPLGALQPVEELPQKTLQGDF